MTHANLIESIAAELRDATKEIRFTTEYAEHPTTENYTPINIFSQYIPADLFDSTTYFPCIIVEWLETEDDIKGSDVGTTVRVGLSIGVFAKESDGWKDAFHLMEVCKERLLRKRTIAERFRLVDKVNWETAQNQPTPFFFVYAELAYDAFLIQEPFDSLTEAWKWKT